MLCLIFLVAKQNWFEPDRKRARRLGYNFPRSRRKPVLPTPESGLNWTLCVRKHGLCSHARSVSVRTRSAQGGAKSDMTYV